MNHNESLLKYWSTVLVVALVLNALYSRLSKADTEISFEEGMTLVVYTDKAATNQIEDDASKSEQEKGE